MRGWQVVRVWVRGLSYLSAAAVLVACAPPSGGGGGSDGGAGGDGGTTGTPGWHLSLPQDQVSAPLLDISFPGAAGGPADQTAPAANNPWRQGELTDKTLDVSGDQGDGHAEAHMTLAISGDTVTVTGSASGSSGGTVVGSASAEFSYVNWCYRPATAASGVRFDVSMNIQTLTVGGTNSSALARFSNWGSTNTCEALKGMSLGTPGDVPASCTTDTVDVTIYPGDDGEACLHGDVDDPQVAWSAVGGDASAAGGGTASVQVVYTIKATPIP